jgi:serine/threonine-protein kinase
VDTDRNLLFGVLALQADFLTEAQFAEACTAWSARKQVPLADVLEERGWLTPADKADIERLLERKLKKHGGDAKASLLTSTLPQLRQVLAGVPDSDVQRSLADLPHNGQPLLSTLAFQPESRDRYTLLRLHAKGGIGQVWLAHDADLGRDVALKELYAERSTNSAVWARFLEEAKITGQLEHPGIVPIYELARKSADQRPFYTMRFIRGRTLSDASKEYHQKRAAGQAGPLDLRELLGNFVAVCNTVGYAHARGVLHRDLKGQNVVLGDFGEVMVLDWGLAKVLGASQPEDPGATSLLPVSVDSGEVRDPTLQGQVLGTPAYMAPEQAEGRTDLLDARTDVYGLGAILYEILTGQPPFSEADVVDTLHKVIHQAPLPPRQVVPSTSPALEAVCLKALSKKPAQRYASAAELARDVQRWLADEPVSTWREPINLRLRRWVKRRQALVTGAAAAILVAMLSLAVGVTLLSQTNERLAGANQELEAANAREKAARQLAEANEQKAADSFRQAREAVDQFFTKVADSKELLAGTVGTQRLRRDLLTLAQKYYERFLKERQDDPAVQEETAKTHLRMGQILAEVNPGREALEALEKGRALQEKLVREAPERADRAFNLASAHIRIGNAHIDADDLPPAQASYESARGLMADLVKQYPKDARYAALLATIHNNLGALEQVRGRPDLSLPYLEEARRIQDELAHKHPETISYQVELARTYGNLGRAWRNLHEREKALAALTTSQNLLAALSPKHPDPEIARGRIDSYREISRVQRDLNKLPEALVALEAARDIAERLAAENPAVADYASALAAAYGNIALVRREMGSTENTMELLGKAQTIYSQLIKQNPGVSQFVLDLARIFRSLGNSHREEGNFPAAMKAFEQAVQLVGDLHAKAPRVPLYAEDLAAMHMDIGHLHLRRGKLDEALGSVQAARDLYTELTAIAPNVPDYAVQRARATNNVGIVLRRLRKFDEAYRQHVLAAQILQPQFQRNPDDPQIKSTLAQAYSGQADNLRELQKYAAAVTEAERALKLASGSELEGVRIVRASLLALLGRVDEATKEAQALTARDSAAPDILYEAACTYALAARWIIQDAKRKPRAEAYEGRAMQLLIRAHQVGYFKDAANVENMKQDSDLKGLRARDDYKKLLAELEERGKRK